MRHFSCDFCGTNLAESAARYVVRVEVTAAHNPAALTEADLDADPVSQMAELLAELEDSGTFPALTPARCEMEYDLCPACRDRFAADPLGRNARRPLRFSPN